MNGVDWSLPPPDEMELWRGERPPASLFLILSFSISTTVLGFVFALVEPLGRALWHPWSLVSYLLLVATVLALRQWSRTTYEITSLRAIERCGSESSELFLHELSSLTVEKGGWAAIFGLARLIIRSPHAELRWRWLLNAEDGLESVERALRGHGLALDVVRSDSVGVMYMPVPGAAPSRKPPAPRTPEDRETSAPRLHPATLAGPILGLVVLIGFVVAGFFRHEAIVYPADDAIYPGGIKRPRKEIVAFMRAEVLPFAKKTIGPLVGGEDQVTCETCHGADAKERNYRMPAVSALPEPDVLSTISEGLIESDSQVQTAVYGYLASPEKLETMRVMRDQVLPGMAELLGRPAYDFTKPLSHNRRNFAFGCYHCHRLDDRRH